MTDWDRVPPGMGPSAWRAWVASQKVPADEVQSWAGLTTWLDEMEAAGETEITRAQIRAQLTKSKRESSPMSCLLKGLTVVSLALAGLALAATILYAVFWLLLFGICGGFSR